MDKLKELKSEAYDLIAALEQKQREMDALREMLAAKNAEISAEISKAESGTKAKTKNNGE